MYHFKIVRHRIGEEEKFEQELQDFWNDDWAPWSKFMIVDQYYIMAVYKNDSPREDPFVQIVQGREQGGGNGSPPDEGTMH